MSAGQCLFPSGCLHPDRVMPEHDLVYIQEGSWEIWQNDSRYLLLPGDVILLHAGQHHFGRIPCEPHTRTLFIHVKNDTGDEFADIQPDEAHVLLSTVLHCQGNDNVERLFKAVLRVFEAEEFMKEQRLSCLVRLLLMELADSKVESKYNRLTREALAILQDHPEKLFRAEEMAALLYVSARTLQNRFKAVFRKSFTQYQMEQKLKKAGLLLRTYPEMRIKEIADSLGFYDEFHLSKVFKQHYGVSPSQYRRASSPSFPQSDKTSGQ